MLSRISLFSTLWTIAHQAPLSMGLSRQEYWSGLSFPSPGDLPNPGIKPESFTSPALAGGFFTTAPLIPYHKNLVENELQFLANWILNIYHIKCYNPVQFSRSVVSDFLWPHELQHARPPCPSPTPGVHPNPCPSSLWCHPAISSSVIPFSSCPQSLPASESFPMSQLFAWGGQSTGVSASAPVLPMHTQDWSPLEWTGWISLQSKGLSRVFSNTTVQKHQFFSAQLTL